MSGFFRSVFGAPAPLQPLPRRQNVPPRVVLVDGDAAVTNPLQAALEDAGVEVRVWRDSDGTLRDFHAASPDIVVLSTETASRNGFLICKRLRKDRELGSISVIITSGDPDAGKIFEQHRKLRTRADHYVQKPATTEELLQVIALCIDLPSSPPDTAT